MSVLHSLLVLNQQPSDEVLGIVGDMLERLLVELPVARLHVLKGLDVVVARER